MSSIGQTLLEIDHLKKSFDGKSVLSDVSFDVKKGEILCLIGQSGHGKSVLLRHIMGLLQPDGGKISYKGEVILSPTTPLSSYEKYRQKFGLLFQGAALFDSLSVSENISFSLKERTDLNDGEIAKKVTDTLAMVGLHDIEDKMPAELSGGMKSRVGLARAVALEPEIMLYDEPTSALDPIMSDHISSLIQDLRDRLAVTTVVITHDIALAYKIADRIAMLYNGEIIFLGTLAEIKKARNPYIRQFLRGQREVFYALESASDDDLDEDELALKRITQQTFRGVDSLNISTKKRRAGDTH